MQSSLFWIWGEFSYDYAMQVEQLFFKTTKTAQQKVYFVKNEKKKKELKLFHYKERLELKFRKPTPV